MPTILKVSPSTYISVEAIESWTIYEDKVFVTMKSGGSHTLRNDDKTAFLYWVEKVLPRHTVLDLNEIYHKNVVATTDEPITWGPV